MPCKKKKYNARFPPARIKKIMQSDEEVGKVAAPVPVIISRGLELFVESLLTKAAAITTARQARTLTPYHLKQCILSEKRFDFLQEVFVKVADINTDADSDAQTPVTPVPQPPDFSAPHKQTAASASKVPKRTNSADPLIKIKRPRGRPRKVPKEAPVQEDSDGALEMDLDHHSNGGVGQNGNCSKEITHPKRSSEPPTSSLQISVQGVPGSFNVAFPAFPSVANGSTLLGQSAPSADLDEDYDD